MKKSDLIIKAIIVIIKSDNLELLNTQIEIFNFFVYFKLYNQNKSWEF